jgi:molybdopterin-guanine dinucleotide biosynthesis protein A
MHTDKALLVVDGRTMLDRTASLLAPLTGPPTVIGPPERYAASRWRVVADLTSGLGPLGGIATALRDSSVPWNLILGCDLPFLTEEWLAYLLDRALASAGDAVVPRSRRGAEPLCAAYRKSAEPRIANALARGVRKVTDALAELNVEAILPDEWKRFDSHGRLFDNMNTPADFEAARIVFESAAREPRPKS